MTERVTDKAASNDQTTVLSFLEGKGKLVTDAKKAAKDANVSIPDKELVKVGKAALLVHTPTPDHPTAVSVTPAFRDLLETLGADVPESFKSGKTYRTWYGRVAQETRATITKATKATAHVVKKRADGTFYGATYFTSR